MIRSRSELFNAEKPRHFLYTLRYEVRTKATQDLFRHSQTIKVIHKRFCHSLGINVL